MFLLKILKEWLMPRMDGGLMDLGGKEMDLRGGGFRANR